MNNPDKLSDADYADMVRYVMQTVTRELIRRRLMPIVLIAMERDSALIATMPLGPARPEDIAAMLLSCGDALATGRAEMDPPVIEMPPEPQGKGGVQ